MNSSTLRVRRWVATVVVLAALAGGAILATGLRNWSGNPVYGAPSLPVAVARDSSPVPLGTFANGFASVLKPALPAVVNIHTSKIVKPKAGESMPFFNDPFFRQFFGDQGGRVQPQPQREQSLGSGVIVTSDGTIVTNNHVIDGATEIKVELADKRDFTAKLVGTDPQSDVAVLKINATGLPTLPIGDSSKLQVGDVVLAIGDPFGIGETATMGIVSATGRGMGGQIERFEDFIQTDAAINPGNSGGAMIDLHGNLVGINTAILSGGSGGNQGIGFAIPINMAHNVMSQLVEHGKVVRGFLGLLPQDVSPEMAKEFGLHDATGALVGSVEPGKPAAQAGLKRGDVILKVNGQPIASANDLRLRISQMAPGSSANLTIWRDNRDQEVKVTLAELEPEKEAQTGQGEESGSGAMQGVQVQNVTPDMIQELGVPEGTHGVVVSSIDPASPAAATELQRGLIIQEVNHRPVNNVQQYKEALQSAGDRSVLLLVMIPNSLSPNSNGVTRYIVVEPH
jgi:Do/DeqQ family serine protease